MQVRLVHEFRFEAAHLLPKVPKGHKCSRLHGHSFKIEVAVAGPVDEETGWFIDYAVLYAAWEPIHAEIDHNYLNDVKGLENPTSENLARWLWNRLQPSLPSLARVTVFETCDARCEYEGLVKTLVCRCEDVTLHELEAAMARGYKDIESVKRYTGFGTGWCQGKGCLALCARMIHERGGDCHKPITPRPPYHPVELATLAGLADLDSSGGGHRDPESDF